MTGNKGSLKVCIWQHAIMYAYRCLASLGINYYSKQACLHTCVCSYSTKPMIYIAIHGIVTACNAAVASQNHAAITHQCMHGL